MSSLDEYIDDVRKRMSKIPFFDKRPVEALLGSLAFVSEAMRKSFQRTIDILVTPKYTAHVLRSRNPVLGFPTEEESKGDITIGQVYAGDHPLYPFGLTTENLRESIFVTARSGHGKTSLVYNFVDQIIQNKIKFLMVDWKQDYRGLANMYSDVLVIKWSDLRFNPLTNCPDGMDLKMWWRIVLNILSHSQGLLIATPSHILQVIEELYEDRKGLITFRDVSNYLAAQNENSTKRKEYSDVAENRIYSINQALDGVINVKYGYRVEDLFHQQVVIEMHPLDFPIASFLIQTMMMHEFYRRLNNQIRLNRKSTLDSYFLNNYTCIIMDECHLTSYSGQERSLVATEFSPPPLTTFFSQSRELLMSTLALSQFPHLVMDSFKTNAGTRIIGNITESDIQRDMASSVGLDRDDEKNIAKLQKGFWIATVAGRTRPFLMNTPDVKKGDLVADAAILHRSRPLLTALEMKRQEIESRMFMTQVERKSEEVHLPEISKEGWLLLDYVFWHEWSYQQKVTEALGLSDRKFAKTKQELLDKKMISIQKFPVKVHDRIHFALTPNALEVMETLGKPAQRIGYWKWIAGVPGYEHRYWQNMLRVKHRILGWTGRIEYDLKDGRRVDLYEEREDYRKAIEIELSTKDVENKTRVLTDREVEELVLLYKDETHLRFARSKLENMENIPKEKIWIGLIRDYIDILDNIIKEPETLGNFGEANPDTPDDNQNRKHDGNIGELG